MLELNKKILRLCVGGVQRTWHSNGASKHHLPFVISCPFVTESAVRVSSRRRDLPFMVITTHRKRCHHHRSRFEKAFLRSMCRPLESAVFVLWNINDRCPDTEPRLQTIMSHPSVLLPTSRDPQTSLHGDCIRLHHFKCSGNRMVSKSQCRCISMPLPRGEAKTSRRAKQANNFLTPASPTCCR